MGIEWGLSGEGGEDGAWEVSGALLKTGRGRGLRTSGAVDRERGGGWGASSVLPLGDWCPGEGLKLLAYIGTPAHGASVLSQSFPRSAAQDSCAMKHPGGSCFPTRLPWRERRGVGASF